MKELPKTYDPKGTEGRIYGLWEKSGFFNPDNLPHPGKPFYIPLPPPNATGQLHIGHALMIALQDLVIRFQRMSGKKTLWLPGMDHAAIATQNVVEKELAKEGKTKYDLGREKFVKRVENFVENSKSTIRNQIKSLGASCDWSREKYTLGPELSQAVREIFTRMYNDDLIYRGKRIVNWCPRCESTLADDEIEYKAEKAKLYYFKYGPLSVATARPETIFGDVALAVNPKDSRYKKYVGQKFTAPWINNGKTEITVVADQAVDPNFGTGVIKVTPAHDLNDYEIAQRHKLTVKQVIEKDGRLNAAAGKYAGLSATDCREKVIADWKKQNLLEKEEDYEHNLSVCYRCGTPVEPLISEQWFLAVNKPIKKRGNKTLKQLCLEAVKTGQIEFIPERFKKVYLDWMENLHDWCISRQLWFGHRIPVWYKSESRITNHESRIYVGVNPPPGEDWLQDPDVLDTWFSSGLWTFSALGWPHSAKASRGKPDKARDLRNYHPADLMETGYDIIFFWVARMVLMTEYALGKIPFKKVYLHGLVRDKQGRKMSKSLGNGIDPREMAKKYGADAVRLSLLIGQTPGNDSRLSEEKIAGFRNFVNKLWNISRFILSTTKEPLSKRNADVSPTTLADKWIFSRLEQTTKIVSEKISNYEISQAGEELRRFTWDELADWYLEIAKVEKNKDELLLFILKRILVLWHPFIPFATEEIWQIISNGDGSLLMIEKWPAHLKSAKADKITKDFSQIQNVIAALRNFRSEYNIPADKKFPVFVVKKYPLLEKEKPIVEKLANIILNVNKQIKGISLSIGQFDFILPLNELIDTAKEKAQTQKELEEKEKYYSVLQKKLANKEFTTKAPKIIIAKEKQKALELKKTIKKLLDKINNL